MPRVPAAGAVPKPGGPGGAPSPGHQAAQAAAAAVASAERAHPVPKSAASTMDSARSVDSSDGQYKAALSELDALRRHLKKGRQITTWQCRHVTEGTLSSIAEMIAKGMNADQAVDVAEIHYTPTPQITKVGPEGYIHGWECVEPPCRSVGDKLLHDAHGAGTITSVDHDGNLHATFSDGTHGLLGHDAATTVPALAPQVRPATADDFKAIPGVPPDAQGVSVSWAAGMDPGEYHVTADQMQLAIKQIHQLRDRYHEIEQQEQQLASTEREEAKELAKAKGKLSWHLGTILAGLGLAAGAAFTALFAGPVVAGVIAAVAGGLPSVAVEWIDFHHKW